MDDPWCLLPSMILGKMMKADLDNSGTIDYTEFVAAMLNLNKAQKADHLVAAFSYFDKDGSGFITTEELQQACEQFGLEGAQLEGIMQEVDKDHDGRIDYNASYNDAFHDAYYRGWKLLYYMKDRLLCRYMMLLVVKFTISYQLYVYPYFFRRNLRPRNVM